MTAVVAAEFGEDAGPRAGRPLVDAAVRAGATWAVVTVGDDPVPLRNTWRAAGAAGVGLIVRLDDTRLLADLADAISVSGDRTVATLRDRLLVVVSAERAGKRLRADVKWAPSAADLAAVGGGLLGLLRRRAPNIVRAACLADDLVVPLGFLPDDRLPALAAKLRSRGGRLWISDVPPERADEVGALPVHGVVVRRN